MDLLLGAERAAIVDFCRRMTTDGLVVGTSGNLSARRDDLIAVTPSAVAYDDLTPAMVGVHRLDGTPVEAAFAPTTEMPMHLAVYRATGTTAIVHTHSPAATAVSTLVDEVPLIHYMTAMFGGPVRVAPYATYGTDELAANACRALDGRTGCLLGNHGAITVGETLAKAYDRTRQLEWMCDVWLRARAVGEPRLLVPDEIDRVVERLKTYGAVTNPDATPDAR